MREQKIRANFLFANECKTFLQACSCRLFFLLFRLDFVVRRGGSGSEEKRKSGSVNLALPPTNSEIYALVLGFASSQESEECQRIIRRALAAGNENTK
jgi:hypothetical protein